MKDEKDLKIEELQKVIDNMYIAAWYNNDIKTFNRIGIAYVYPVVLGRTTRKYTPMENDYWVIDENGLTFKELEDK